MSTLAPPVEPTSDRRVPGQRTSDRRKHSAAAPIDACPAPVTGWRRAAVDFVLVGGTEVICQVMSVAAGLVLRVVLNPAEMGVWQGLKLLLGYGNYANLGVSKGAAREFAVARGRQDTTHAQRSLSLAFTVNTLSSLVFAAALVAISAWVGASSTGAWSGAWALGLVVVGTMAIISRYTTFHVTILRAAQAFHVTSQLSILEAALTLVVCGLAAWYCGLVGLYAGTLVVLLATVLFINRHRAVELSWGWDTAEIRRLIRIGGPILLAGTVSTLFRSLDKLMILGYLEDREFQLGCYSLALMVTTQLYGIGNMLSVVMGPRLSEQFGHSGSRNDVALLTARTTELQAAVVALPAALAVVLAPAVLGRLLPEYQSGLAPVEYLVPGVIALALALPATQYLVAVDRQGWALATVVIATLLAAGGNHVALRGGCGLTGVAAVTAISYVVYWLLTMFVSVWPELTRPQRVRYFFVPLLAVLPPLVVSYLAERLFPGIERAWSLAAAKAAVVLVVWTIVVALGWRYGGWSVMLQKKQPGASTVCCGDPYDSAS